MRAAGVFRAKKSVVTVVLMAAIMRANAQDAEGL
jgi:hypothetical protein